jgi:hypothetical protein
MARGAARAALLYVLLPWPAVLAAMVQDAPAGAGPPPHRPLIEVKFVLLPAPRAPSGLPAVSLDERPAVAPPPQRRDAWPSAVPLLGAYAPNTEICRGRECEGGRRTR